MQNPSVSNVLVDIRLCRLAMQYFLDAPSDHLTGFSKMLTEITSMIPR
ncbi:MAG: hypothetical protein RL151_628, partial [Bacteroidota bacterium]